MQAEAEGSVRHALTVVMSLVRVETEPNCAGMEVAALKGIVLSANIFCQALVRSPVPLDPIPISKPKQSKVQFGLGLTLKSHGPPTPPQTTFVMSVTFT